MMMLSQSLIYVPSLPLSLSNYFSHALFRSATVYSFLCLLLYIPLSVSISFFVYIHFPLSLYLFIPPPSATISPSVFLSLYTSL